MEMFLAILLGLIFAGTMGYMFKYAYEILIDDEEIEED